MQGRTDETRGSGFYRKLLDELHDGVYFVEHDRRITCGEELLMVVANVDENGLRRVAERCRVLVDRSELRLESQPVHVTVCTLDPQQGSSLGSVSLQAQAAGQFAKTCTSMHRIGRV